MNRLCEKCGIQQATEKHHKLSQTKLNRKIYGKLLDESFNIMYLCYRCHHDKSLDKFTELEFREIAQSLGYYVPLGTKSFQLRRSYERN